MGTVVNVSAANIKYASGKACCPVALAMRDAGIDDPCVGLESISFSDDRGHRRIKTPPEAAAFVTAYDRGEHPKPITFEIDLSLSAPAAPQELAKGPAKVEDNKGKLHDVNVKILRFWNGEVRARSTYYSQYEIHKIELGAWAVPALLDVIEGSL